ncbi:MAG: DUF1071 domain-containing protein [Alphaproteobacteria bacterium]|nr:DUF1071 domain-containing protein [Alphaproteobacteria bacterium]
MTLQEKIEKLYTELQGSNIKEFTSKKDTGRSKLDYLSWGAAVDFFTKGCHKMNLDWTYSHKFIDMGSRGSFVETTITIMDSENGDTIEKSMALPCMTNTSQAAKDADVTVINKTQMRCLVKCMTLFGLGLSLYLKDFSELDEVKLATAAREEENAKKLANYKARFKLLLDQLKEGTDTSAFADYETIDDLDTLIDMGKALKKIVDAQGVANENI